MMSKEISGHSKASSFVTDEAPNSPISLDTEIFIQNYGLHKRLGLVRSEDILIFDLSFEERLYREEIIKTEKEITGINRSLPGFIRDRIDRSKKEKIAGLYKSKERLSSIRQEISDHFSPSDEKRAHLIDLAANGLFVTFQMIHGQTLSTQKLLSGYMLKDWEHVWRSKIRGK